MYFSIRFHNNQLDPCLRVVKSECRAAHTEINSMAQCRSVVWMASDMAKPLKGFAVRLQLSTLRIHLSNSVSRIVPAKAILFAFNVDAWWDGFRWWLTFYKVLSLSDSCPRCALVIAKTVEGTRAKVQRSERVLSRSVVKASLLTCCVAESLFNNLWFCTIRS